MTKTCNLANLYAAVRVTAWPALRAIAVITAFCFALAGLAGIARLAVNPADVANIAGDSRYYFAACFASLAGFVVYGMYRDWITTMQAIVAVMLTILVVLGSGAYVAWLATNVPDFNLDNVSALFAVSSAPWQVRAGLIPAQVAVILFWLPAVGAAAALGWYVVSEVCKYGARVRAREPQETA